MTHLARSLTRTTALLALVAGCSSNAGDGSESSSSDLSATVGAREADAATQALLDRFWDGSYLRSSDPATSGACGTSACYWIFAQAFESVVDAAQRTRDARFHPWIDRLFAAQERRGFIEPTSSKFFDDENWMALALIRAYDVTGDAKYLCHAVTLYRDIKSEGFDYVRGAFAGVWWNAAHTQKATASNFGPAITAARLHERAAMDSCASAQRGVVDAPTLREDARMIFDHWLTHMTRLEAQGERKVADHRAPDCPGDVCWADYTYNEGLGIGAAVELHHVTGEGAYLDVANELARYMVAHQTGPGGVLRDDGKCGGDCAAFKGIGYRYLLRLYEVDKRAEYADVLRASARAIWRHARSARDTFATEWTGPAPERTTLAADASAVMALNLAVEWGL